MTFTIAAFYFLMNWHRSTCPLFFWSLHVSLAKAMMELCFLRYGLNTLVSTCYIHRYIYKLKKIYLRTNF